MARADFVFLSIDEQLNGGNTETTPKTFKIDGKPTGQGYVLIQTFDLQQDDHKILINGKDLPVMDLPANPVRQQWQTWMDRIPAGILKQGDNTIKITKVGTDEFFVRGVSINWREEG